MHPSNHPKGSERSLALFTFPMNLEAALLHYLPDIAPKRLADAMAYSLEGPAKRLRPRLLLAARAIDPGSYDPKPAAVALEYVHSYSLIHDDLPCMDDSPLRRNKPSCHMRFDEATALMAGNALMNRAYELLCLHYPAEPKLIATLCTAVERLLGGQMLDVTTQALEASILYTIHHGKTAALFQACLRMGGLLNAAPSEGFLAQLDSIGLHLGLGFQLIDDFLDATQSADTLGKPGQQDIGKLSAVALYGLEATQRKALEHVDAALAEIDALPGETTELSLLAEEMKA